jgi:hypothetical protein
MALKGVKTGAAHMVLIKRPGYAIFYQIDGVRRGALACLSMPAICVGL